MERRWNGSSLCLLHWNESFYKSWEYWSQVLPAQLIRITSLLQTHSSRPESCQDKKRKRKEDGGLEQSGVRQWKSEREEKVEGKEAIQKNKVLKVFMEHILLRWATSRLQNVTSDIEPADLIDSHCYCSFTKSSRSTWSNVLSYLSAQQSGAGYRGCVVSWIQTHHNHLCKLWWL